MKTFHIVSKLGTVVMISEKEFIEFINHLNAIDPSYYFTRSAEDFGSFELISKDYYSSKGELLAMIRESD